MAATEFDPLKTRASLLERLKDCDDQASWQEFHNIYRQLIGNFARKHRVPEHAIEDIIQDTLIAVVRAIRDFRYTPEKCSFKSWLLTVTCHRVADHFRRHAQEREKRHKGTAANPERTSTAERIPDPQSLMVDRIWDQEWKNKVVELALERFKTQASTKHFQIFYLAVIKEQPTSKVARALGVSSGQVYLVKHRLKGVFEKLVRKLERELDAFESEGGRR